MRELPQEGRLGEAVGADLTPVRACLGRPDPDGAPTDWEYLLYSPDPAHPWVAVPGPARARHWVAPDD